MEGDGGEERRGRGEGEGEGERECVYYCMATSYREAQSKSLNLEIEQLRLTKAAPQEGMDLSLCSIALYMYVVATCLQ